MFFYRSVMDRTSPDRLNIMKNRFYDFIYQNITYWAAGPRYREFKELPKVCLYSCSLVWFVWFGLVWFGFALGCFGLVWFWLGLVGLGLV